MMMRMTRLTCMLLILGVNVALGQTNGFCNLVWNDEFEGTTLNSAWTKEQTCYGGGNNELECYTARDKNVFLDNGALVLKAYRETYTGSQNGCTDTQGCTNTQPYTSGRVNTAASHSWTYGRFETRAKLPRGTHLWPAIWMMPTDYRYGGWAASGEIDIMESRGDTPTLVSGTVHHGAAWPNNVYTTTGDHSLNGADLTADFHVYSLEWTAASIKWYIDSTLTQEYSLDRWWNVTNNGVYSAHGQPFDQRFHFILNLAVGGGFFNGYPTNWDSNGWTQPELRVDYVRVWSQGGNCGAAVTPTSAAATPTAGNDAGGRPTTSAATTTPGTCNGQGYDSSHYTCTINELGKQVLCPSGTSSCGSACYSDSQYCCNSGNLLAKAACPAVAASRAATSAAATSAAATPTSSATPTSNASSGNGKCNNQGYDARFYTCTTNEANAQVLCPTGLSSCGGACYLPSLYCCKNHALAPKGTC